MIVKNSRGWFFFLEINGKALKARFRVSDWLDQARWIVLKENWKGRESVKIYFDIYLDKIQRG